MAFTYKAKGSILFKILLSFKAAMEIGRAPGQLIQPGVNQTARGIFLPCSTKECSAVDKQAGGLM